jgi:hypothetical protein
LRRLAGVRQVCLWVVGVFLGALASSAVTRIEPGPDGWQSDGVIVLGWVVFSFVTVSVVTAMETVFPSLRRRRGLSPLRRH